MRTGATAGMRTCATALLLGNKNGDTEWGRVEITVGNTERGRMETTEGDTEWGRQELEGDGNETETTEKIGKGRKGANTLGKWHEKTHGKTETGVTDKNTERGRNGNHRWRR